MKSPFPGMDPFIEVCGLWEDFHGHLIEEISRSLSALAPEGYLVRTGEHAYVALIESEGREQYSFNLDVSITSKGKTPTQAISGGVALAETESYPMRAFIATE